MYLIKIAKPYGSYAVGQVVDFPDEVAKALVKAGVAVDYQHPNVMPTERMGFTKKMVKKDN